MLAKMSNFINAFNCNRIDVVETGIGNWEEIKKKKHRKTKGWGRGKTQ